MKTLAEELPKEQQRVRDLITVYDSLPTGGFGAMMLRQALHRSEVAAAAGDVVAMLRAYNELKECE